MVDSPEELMGESRLGKSCISIVTTSPLLSQQFLNQTCSVRLLSLSSIKHKRSHTNIRDGAVRELKLRPEKTQTPLSVNVDEYYGGKGQVRETDFETLFGDENIKYEDLPIVHMKCTRNNTHIDVTAPDGNQIFYATCGIVGFHNAKKGTTTAAQAVGTYMGNQLQRRNIKTVRIVVKGIGPGRLMAIKGLQMTGVQIISITDNTKIPVLWNNIDRPKKMRRV
ncbi:unnamed protein product [Didymodactylos carnosus]|uniref:Ribosomal protein S11 n=1 Tax=Didymodactylos carnosus TaxID=1234261 RepID=A0A813RS92_9BILA|nr:unnamed protein product [Didymodactylos carnosus]CAF0951940.1 unnamed protein product [Didymodactylos carnosus]CAF3570621.1 unnamed protein product [Didymodactylos carnosus]CAF3725988.1 unnamed protein product [Didymodactylos carnosus]